MSVIKLEEKRGKPWFDIVKIKLDDLSKIDKGFWDWVISSKPNPNEKPPESNYELLSYDPTTIDDQGNIIFGGEQNNTTKVGWFFEVRWLYKIYEALEEILGFLPNLNPFKELFNFVDILISSLKRIEEWLEEHCE